MVRRYARWLVKGLTSELWSNLRPGARYAGPPLVPRSSGRALVTGGTGAIGEAVCRGLAARGFDVIVGARDGDAGRRVAADLARDYPGAAARVAIADLDGAGFRPADLDLDDVALLVNNAAIMGGPRDATYRVNLLAPARLSLAVLARNPRCRVVNVASSSHLRAAAVDLARLGDARKDASLAAYAESKLGLLQVTAALRRAGADSVACHPGLVWTPMMRGFFKPTVCTFLEVTRLRRALFRTPEQGAATVLAACLAPERVGGDPPYFVDGRPRPALASPEASRAPGAALWEAVILRADELGAKTPLARALLGAGG